MNAASILLVYVPITSHGPRIYLNQPLWSADSFLLHAACQRPRAVEWGGSEVVEQQLQC